MAFFSNFLSKNKSKSVKDTISLAFESIPEDEYNSPEIAPIEQKINSLYNQYEVSINADKFYKLGYNTLGQESLNDLLEGAVKPTFKSLKENIEILFRSVSETIQNEIKSLDHKINCLNNRIKTDADSHVDAFNIEIEAIKQHISKNSELEESFFHEKKMIALINDEFKRYREDIENTNLEFADDSDLDILFKNIKTTKLAENYLKSISKIKSSFSEHIHSNYFPPSRKYIFFFFFTCFLLLFGEIGFSYKIANNLISLTNIFRSYLNLNTINFINNLVILTLCIAMSLSIAVFFKFCFDYLLFSNVWYKKISFWLIYISFSLLIYNFYRTGTLTSSFFDGEALMMTFFSILFATANALLFREATYLDRLSKKTRTWKEQKDLLINITNQKNSFIERTLRHIAKIESKKSSLLSILNDVSPENLESYKKICEGLESVSISMCKKGFEDRLNELITNDEEYHLVIERQIRKVL